MDRSPKATQFSRTTKTSRKVSINPRISSTSIDYVNNPGFSQQIRKRNSKNLKKSSIISKKSSYLTHHNSLTQTRSKLGFSKQSIKDLIYKDPKFHTKITKLKSLFRKVILVIRVTLICKKLIASSEEEKLLKRRRTFLEDIQYIREKIDEKQKNDFENFENQKLGIFNPEKFRIDPPKFQIHKNLRHLLCLPQSERFSPEVLEIQAILELKFSRFKCQWIAWPKQVRNNLCRILSYQQVEKGKTIIKYGHIAYNYYLVF